MDQHRFYTIEASEVFTPPPLAAGYELSIWRPSLRRVAPSGISGWQFAVWWLFHYLRVFSNNDYAVTTIRHDGRVVHHTCVFPRYFRFPFMRDRDLQLGDTWTEPAYRGQSLAVAALMASLHAFSASERRFWYLTDADNHSSQRVVEKSGFSFAGEGVRTSRFGVRALGQYQLVRESASARRAA